MLDLYKLAVEMADRVSARRALANAFFVTVQSALATALGFFAAKGIDPGEANTRTVLGCIEVLYLDDDTQIASAAQYAWDSLSQPSHYHAYELATTLADVAALIAVVKKLSLHGGVRHTAES